MLPPCHLPSCCWRSHDAIPEVPKGSETCPRELTWVGVTSAGSVVPCELEIEVLVLDGFCGLYVQTVPRPCSLRPRREGFEMRHVAASIMFSAALLTTAELVRVGFCTEDYLIWLLHMYVSGEQIPSSCLG